MTETRNRFMRKYRYIVIFICLSVFAYFLYTFYFAGPDLSTPEATVAAAQKFIEEEEWEQLHGLLTEEFAEKTDQKVKQLLRFMAGRSSGEHTEDLRRLTALTARGRFVALLEALIQEPRTADILKKYQNVVPKIEEQNLNTVLLKAENGNNLPIKKVKLTREDKKWLISDFSGLSG
ncbi:MAG: hypothetical protein ACLFN5_02610 [bacterium]